MVTMEVTHDIKMHYFLNASHKQEIVTPAGMHSLHMQNSLSTFHKSQFFLNFASGAFALRHQGLCPWSPIGDFRPAHPMKSGLPAAKKQLRSWHNGVCKRGLCHHAVPVWLGTSVSVTFVYCVESAKYRAIVATRNFIYRKTVAE